MKIFKRSIPILVIIFFMVNVFSVVCAQPCGAGSAIETLDGANANIRLSSSGLWGYDSDLERPTYGWPWVEDESSYAPSVIFAGNLWMGAVDSGSNLKVAAKTYGLDDTNGYWPGPINEDGSVSEQNCANWDRLFKITKIEIENFQADFSDNQQLDDPIPPRILGWPGANSTTFFDVHGFSLPENNFSLASFFDQNNDGIYNPNEGDHPLIKFADEAVWWVFNDIGNLNFVASQSLGVEVQMLAYVYNSTLDNVRNSSFYDVKVINKGTDLLDTMFMGLWIDPDLGCPYDDYLGSVPEENLGFVYNADAIDGIDEEGTCPPDFDSYEEPPMVGIKLLEGPFNTAFSERLNLNSFIFYDNFPGTPPPMEPPVLLTEFYNMLTGRRNDGALFLDQNNEPTNFLFTGNPANTSSEWSMCSEESINLDRRILMSVGPMRLNPLQENNMTFAVVVLPQSELPCPDVTTLVTAADLPTPSNAPGSFYDQLVTSNEEEAQPNTKISVFPNPVSDQLNFEISGEDTFLSIQLNRIDGQLVRQKMNLQSTRVVLPRNQFVAGTYIYQVQTQKGNSVGGKIILK